MHIWSIRAANQAIQCQSLALQGNVLVHQESGPFSPLSNAARSSPPLTLLQLFSSIRLHCLFLQVLVIEESEPCMLHGGQRGWAEGPLTRSSQARSELYFFW